MISDNQVAQVKVVDADVVQGLKIIHHNHTLIVMLQYDYLASRI